MMKNLLLYFKKVFLFALTREECEKLNLEFSHNIYGDAINILNCRSVWRDSKFHSYRCKDLILDKE